MRNYVENVDIVKGSAHKVAYKKWLWLDLLALGLILFLIVLGQLVWIPDSFSWGKLYWIDIIDELIYICLLPPILWAISAWLDFAMIMKLIRDNARLNISHLILGLARAISLISAILTIYGVIFAQEQYLRLAICLVVTWMMSMISIHIKEWNEFKKPPHRSLTIFVINLLMVYLLVWPTNEIVTYPGLTMNMNEYAQVENGRSDDQITGVLIFERPAFRVDRLYAKLFSEYEFTEKAESQPSLREQLQVVRTQQLDANEVASAVAFGKVGIGKGALSHGARVVSLTKGLPADRQLELDDIIIQALGNPISTTVQLINYIKQLKPGEELPLTIVRQNETLQVIIQTQADAMDSKKAVVGVGVTDVIELDLPLKVNFQPYLLNVGGPSHGAMLTLAIIDQLTAGGVTYGNQVAGTGTINGLGQIGKIGGISQKAYTIERTDVDVFFVPAEQYEEAKQIAIHLNIVPVETIDDILNWLMQHPKN